MRLSALLATALLVVAGCTPVVAVTGAPIDYQLTLCADQIYRASCPVQSRAWTYDGVPYPTDVNPTLTAINGYQPWPWDPISTQMTDPPEWPSAEATDQYYIDKYDAGCSDANTYGWPDTPRCSAPPDGTLGTGATITFVGDGNPLTTNPYDPGRTLDYQWPSCGQANPCAFRGLNETSFEPTVAKTGTMFDFRTTGGVSHLTIRDFTMRGGNTTGAADQAGPRAIRLSTTADPNDHIVTTGVTIRDWVTEVQPLGGGDDNASLLSVIGECDNCIAYANTALNIGQIPRGQTTDTGYQLFPIGCRADNVWVIDNVVDMASEDVIHVLCQNANLVDHTDLANGIYFSGNTVNTTAENVVDAKSVKMMIISDNVTTNMYGNPPNVMVFNDEGPVQGPVFIFRNVSGGQSAAASQVDGMFVSDQYNPSQASITPAPFFDLYVFLNLIQNSGGIRANPGGSLGGSIRVERNTFDRVLIQSGRGAGTGSGGNANGDAIEIDIANRTLLMDGNIITETDGTEINLVNSGSPTFANNTCFDSTGGIVVDSPATCTDRDPLLNADGTLANGSSEIDAGPSLATTLAAYTAATGMTITEALGGTALSLGAGPDRGAYERAP